MGRIEDFREQLHFELKERVWDIGIGAGFLTVAGAGVAAAITGEPIGVLPATVGTGLAIASFRSAQETHTTIDRLRTEIAEQN